MIAQFIVRTDPIHDLVRIALSGFFVAADVTALRDALAAQHKRLLCPRHQHVTLIDVSRMSVQSQEMVAAFHDLLADPRFHSRRLAFVVDPTLIRSQLRRALGERPARYFDNEYAAEAWLLALDPAAATAA